MEGLLLRARLSLLSLREWTLFNKKLLAPTLTLLPPPLKISDATLVTAEQEQLLMITLRFAYLTVTQ